MTPEAFSALLIPVTDAIRGKPLDAELGEFLNREFGPQGEAFRAIEAACREAVGDGWMCSREAGGIKFGRVLKPSPALGGCSVDVVEMNDCKGPHHRHPNGEIDMIMPLEGDARFDGRPAGWLVYPAGSGHKPTVTGGRALVLYLLPEGRIQFTR